MKCMDVNEDNKDHVCNSDNLFNYRQPHQHIHLNEKKQVLIFKKWKETFTYWKLKDTIF